MADQILNVRLYDNPLTPEINDYTGRVQLNGNCIIRAFNTAGFVITFGEIAGAKFGN